MRSCTCSILMQINFAFRGRRRGVKIKSSLQWFPCLYIYMQQCFIWVTGGEKASKNCGLILYTHGYQIQQDFFWFARCLKYLGFSGLITDAKGILVTLSLLVQWRVQSGTQVIKQDFLFNGCLPLTQRKVAYKQGGKE